MRKFFGLLVPLLVVANALASDWTDRNQNDGVLSGGDDPGRTECFADFVVDQYPYFNSSTLVEAGNDCLIRSSEDHIYEIHVLVAGIYTF